MTAPVRVQLSRQKGWRLPANTMKVDRSTRWGNPFNATADYCPFYPPSIYPAPMVRFRAPASLEKCIDLFIAYLRGILASKPDFLQPLRGKNLACWCPLDRPCHADVLLDLANR